MSANEVVDRLISERKRLGLTVAQLAVLIGISEELQTSIETGDFSACPDGYWEAISCAGGDPMFILGETPEPVAQGQDLLFVDESFLEAVNLLRKSRQAVDAFLGEGVSKSSPALVAALMNATLQERYSLGSGHLDSFAMTIAMAIEAAGGDIANAMNQQEYGLGPGHLEDLANTIAMAIEAAGGDIADAVNSSVEE